ncbi:LytR C-terminal domain-containing protein [Streptomyces sp. MK37H]|uniref:LytR C-terminal domain-containing protein n=1 Tax=Streptomyces sp. MK37H TaxID=2699117 RepID=UPI001B36CA4A|nr:LytR C-terminal domain-containing protein [Streptomyces sp. MK37H]MBP8535917.1 LytR family transcriptional regulator [Streptomyces sp. MK37H]
MSMLTPPGMGGKYRITGDRYPRMSRPRNRRRLMFTAFGSVLALGLVGWGTLQLIDVFSGDSGGQKVRAAHGTGDCERGDKRPDENAKSGRADSGQSGQGGQHGRTGGKLPKPSQITVNVYNATTRSGLAKDTAKELEKRGFKIGKVGNAPTRYDKKVKATGILLGAPGAGDGAFNVLGTQLPGAQTKNDARDGKDIDLIIGNGFKDLVGQKDADKALAALAKPSPAPSGSPCR